MVADHAQDKAAGLDKWGKKVARITEGPDTEGTPSATPSPYPSPSPYDQATHGYTPTPTPAPTSSPHPHPEQMTTVQMARLGGNTHEAQKNATKMAAKAAELKRVCWG